MSQRLVFECDRCHAEIDGQRGARLTLVNMSDLPVGVGAPRGAISDLCSDCTDKFMAWRKDGKT